MPKQIGVAPFYVPLDIKSRLIFVPSGAITWNIEAGRYYSHPTVPIRKDSYWPSQHLTSAINNQWETIIPSYNSIIVRKIQRGTRRHERRKIKRRVCKLTCLNCKNIQEVQGRNEREDRRLFEIVRWELDSQQVPPEGSALKRNSDKTKRARN